VGPTRRGSHLRVRRHRRDHYASPDSTFDGPNGQYEMFAMGPGGHLVRHRKFDGEHLCPAGAARLGQLVYTAFRTPLGLGPPARNWQSGSRRQDPVYMMSTAYDARTLKLTSSVCPPA
jgi:hypothetical protein